MLTNFALEQLLDKTLNSQAIKDISPNGLQVEGKTDVKKVVIAVTATIDAVEYAAKVGADALLVHHGYFWPNNDKRIRGYNGKRIRTLIKNDINLYQYHFPLDQHHTLGNNAVLCQSLLQACQGQLVEPTQENFLSTCDFTKVTGYQPENALKAGSSLPAPGTYQVAESDPFLFVCRLLQPISVSELAKHLTTICNDHPALVVEGRPYQAQAHKQATSQTQAEAQSQPATGQTEPTDQLFVQTVGICSGGAHGLIEQAYEQGCDAYVSGEITEYTTHSARELGISYFCMGHHDTETHGVKALGKFLEKEHGLEVLYYHYDNPA